MQDDEEQIEAAKEACREIIRRVELPDPRQRIVCHAASDGIAAANVAALKVGQLIGLSPKQSLDAIKSTLAGYLAGLDALDLEEIGRNR